MNIVFANIVFPTPLHPEVVGGAEVSTKLLAQALVAKGHRALVLRGLPPGAPPSDESVDGIRVIGYPIRNLYWPFDGRPRSYATRGAWQLIDNIPIAAQEVRNVLYAFSPTVLYTSNLIGLTWGMWRLASSLNIPIIHILRDYYLICGRGSRFSGGHVCRTTCMECRLATVLRRPATRLVRSVVGISRSILDTHLAAGTFSSAAFARVIPNIAEEGQRFPSSGKDEVVFGYIGRISPEKGVELLASSFASLPPSARLVIAGKVSDEIKRRLESLAGRAVEFLGFVPSQEFYSRVDVVVVPSLWNEPFSRAAIEAQAHGRPVLGSTRGGVAEAMGDPRSGWLFDPGKAGDLSEKMRYLAAHPMERIQAAIAAYEARRKNSPEVVAEMHLALIRETTSGTVS